MTLILSAIYFFLPAYAANMAPVFARALSLPFGNPLSSTLFGANKTYRGVYGAYFFALGILFLQRALQQREMLEAFRLLNYDAINPFFFALLFGGGAMAGDIAKSFCKRRLGKKSGEPWVPFDQLDFVVGALIFLSPFYLLSWQHILVLVVITPILHVLTNISAYLLGLKDVWW